MRYVVRSKFLQDEDIWMDKKGNHTRDPAGAATFEKSEQAYWYADGFASFYRAPTRVVMRIRADAQEV